MESFKVKTMALTFTLFVRILFSNINCRCSISSNFWQQFLNETLVVVAIFVTDLYFFSLNFQFQLKEMTGKKEMISLVTNDNDKFIRKAF